MRIIAFLYSYIMKPPICAICRKKFSEKGGLIYFKETEADRNFNKRFKQKGFVGHPSNAFWFCKEHYKTAVQYKNLTKEEAFPEIKKHTH